MIVDTHVHPISDDFARYPLSPGGGPEWYLDDHYTAEEILAQMDRSGVDQMVLVSSASAYNTDNSYAADAAARYPARFVGVCRIDGNAPDAPDVLSSWITGRGMKGARLGAGGPKAFPACTRAQELGIPVAIQIPGERLEEFRQVAERFPDVKLILDHMAHPQVEDGPPFKAAAPLFALADYPNVHLKFSSMNIREAGSGQSTPRTFFGALLDRFGAERLLWGSDFPHTTGSKAEPYKDLVDLAHEAMGFLSASDREQLLAGTARSLFPTLAAAG